MNPQEQLSRLADRLQGEADTASRPGQGKALEDIAYELRFYNTLTSTGMWRWCQWPECMRSYNAATGPDPKVEGGNWIRVRAAGDVLLCPDHADTGHRPQTFTWQPGDKTIGMSCECGAGALGLRPTTHEACMTWWESHVKGALR